MWRTLGVLVVAWVGSALIVSGAFAADAGTPRRNGQMWGTVIQATADSLTIAPEAPPAPTTRRSAKRSETAAAGAAAAEKSAAAKPPAEQTFALAKDQTELMFAEINMQRTTSRGTIFRSLAEPEPATAADLKAGQLLQVTPVDNNAAAAKRVIIVWSVPGTLVRVDADTITFRPAAAAAAPAADAAKQDKNVGDGGDEMLAINKETTRVRIATTSDPRPAPDGRGIVQSIEFKSGALGDLKADQSVIVCVRNERAVKITILAGNEKP